MALQGARKGTELTLESEQYNLPWEARQAGGQGRGSTLRVRGSW